jgi:hypothetical protein
MPAPDSIHYRAGMLLGISSEGTALAHRFFLGHNRQNIVADGIYGYLCSRPPVLGEKI